MVRGYPALVGLGEPKHCTVGSQAGYFPEHTVFDSLSLQPPNLIDELFQRGNQYAVLEDNVVATMKRTVTSTSDNWSGSGGKGKGKRDRHNRDAEQEQSDGVSVHTSGHRGWTVRATGPRTAGIRTSTMSK